MTKTYFVTGASGAVGSAIVPLLCKDAETRVRLLLRAKSDAHLVERLEELFRFWAFAPGHPARDQIEALRGDAAEPRFGLDESAYARLCADTTHVIHCAATVRMNETLDEARHSAVGSANAVLAFARQLAAAGTLQKIDFVSTVGIAGKRPGALPERWIDEPREFHNTYEQSKAEAEVLVRKAIEDEKLPITVHRPSMVIGDSRTGKIIHFQIFYFICEFLSGRKTKGLYPDFGEVKLDVIPVDWVADSIVAASLDPTTAGRIFHLCSGPEQAPRLQELKAVVRAAYAAAGLDVPLGVRLPRGIFALLPRLAGLFAPPDKRRALLTLPIYLDYLADRQGFENTRHRQWRESQGERFPLWRDYIDPVLRTYLQQRKAR